MLTSCSAPFTIIVLVDHTRIVDEVTCGRAVIAAIVQLICQIGKLKQFVLKIMYSEKLLV